MKKGRINSVRSKIKNKEELSSHDLQQVAFLPVDENRRIITNLYGCNKCPYGAYGALNDSGRCKFEGAHSNNICIMRYNEVMDNLKVKGGSLQELYDLHMISKYFHFKETEQLSKEGKNPGKSWWSNQSQVFHQGKQIHEAVEGKKLKVEHEASPADIAKMIHKVRKGEGQEIVHKVKNELDRIEDDNGNNNERRRIANTA